MFNPLTVSTWLLEQSQRIAQAFNTTERVVETTATVVVTTLVVVATTAIIRKVKRNKKGYYR